MNECKISTGRPGDEDITLALPRPQTFRQSLLLPPLTARFSLLQVPSPIHLYKTHSRIDDAPYENRSPSQASGLTDNHANLSRLRAFDFSFSNHDGHRPSIRDSVERFVSSSNEETQNEDPPLRRVAIVILALDLVFFLVALDRTIVATAVPSITDEFHSLADVGWYGNTYTVAECSFQLFWGRVYTFHPPRVVMLFSIILFLVGSALCGSAPSSIVFIVGRAVAGLGSAGIFSGAVVIMTRLVPLETRPKLQGMIGAIFGVAFIAGPLLGGVFTTYQSWRFCFYINLPIGALAVGIMLLVSLQPSSSKNIPVENHPTLQRTGPIPSEKVNEGSSRTSFSRRVMELDPVGTLLFLPGITCLLLVLSLEAKPSHDKSEIICLWVIFALLMTAFFIFQKSVPLHLVKQRSIAAGMFTQLFIGGSMFSMIYYLSIWLQAIKGATAFHSGIMTLPLIISIIIASITSGVVISRIGYYMPSLILGTALMSIGAGFMTSFDPHTSHMEWIGYQVVYGLGLGIAMQQASLAAQTVLLKRHVPLGVALMQFSQALGGALALGIAQNVFAKALVGNLKEADVSGVDPVTVLETGVTDMAGLGGGGGLLGAYNGAITKSFQVTLVLSSLAFTACLFMEWRSLKKGAETNLATSVEESVGSKSQREHTFCTSGYS